MKSTLFTIFILISSISFSQQLDGQFNILLEETETFKEYKVIKTQELKSFWKRVLDSLNANKQILKELAQKNSDLNQNVNALNTELKQTKAQAEFLQNKIASINVFGIDVDKTVYKVFNFTLLTSLALIISLILVKLKERIHVARLKVKDYNTLESKFEEYRKKALENQMKLRRELQTERNKLNEVTSI